MNNLEIDKKSFYFIAIKNLLKDEFKKVNKVFSDVELEAASVGLIKAYRDMRRANK